VVGQDLAIGASGVNAVNALVCQGVYLQDASIRCQEGGRPIMIAAVGIYDAPGVALAVDSGAVAIVGDALYGTGNGTGRRRRAGSLVITGRSRPSRARPSFVRGRADGHPAARAAVRRRRSRR